MEAFLTGLAANILASVVVKISTKLIRKLHERQKVDAVREVMRLEEKLTEAKTLFDDQRITETRQCKTADIFRVCYDIEDLVDDLLGTDLPQRTGNSLTKVMEVLTKKGKEEVSKKSEKKKKSTSKKIKEVRERLEAIINNLKSVNKTQQQEQQRECHALESEFPTLGREKEKEKIISWLLDDKKGSVSIVGIGGLGKTSLAKHVEGDRRIQEKFHHNIRWFSVSAKFDAKAVAESILRESRKRNHNLFSRIMGFFREECVLIVLDGLQDVKCEEWNSFSSLFPPTSAGCKILITTLNPLVASMTSMTHYHLPLMSPEDCQEVAIHRAINVRGLSGHQLATFKGHVVAIANMSKGLPLAASSLGLTLSATCSRGESITLSDEDIYNMTVYKDEIFPGLKHNAADMKSHLKRCLAYCSLFPRDHHFERDTLVQLWIAEGFIPPEDAGRLQEMGKEYFNELYSRSFFQPSQLGGDEISTETSYTMHEFTHRFTQSVASASGCLRLESENLNEISDGWYEEVRHLSLLRSVPLEDFKECDLRTILLPGERDVKIGKIIPPSFFKNLRRLRVLDLSGTDVEEITGTLCTLKFLRYLDLSKTGITRLSISNLELQVLKLSGCTKLPELPQDLKTLTSLVHLEVDMQKLSVKPAHIGKLIQLRKLPYYFVSEGEGKGITELKNLNSLRGTLKLGNLGVVKKAEEAKEANLNEKHLLNRLELEWSKKSTNETENTQKAVFAGLQPNENVKELKVTDYVGSSFPTWLTNESCKLVSIELKDCWLDDVLPTLGQLLFLEILHLDGLHRVTHMRYPDSRDENVGAFPSLKSLKIENMEHLTSWDILPDKYMLKLNYLTITDCPSLSLIQSLNHVSSLQELEIVRCPELKALPQLPPSVQSLVIWYSNMVEQQCRGRQFYMIRSIPGVEINGKDFFENVAPFWRNSFFSLFFSCLNWL